MRSSISPLLLKSLSILVVLIFVFGQLYAQPEQQAGPPERSGQEADDDENEKKDRKRKNEFKVFGGVNFNDLNVSSDQFTSNTNIGFLLGAAYKQGRFFYWEIGARYNSPNFNLTPVSLPSDSSNSFALSTVDIPITGGINFLSFMSRIVGLRIFVSAVPTFVLGVGSNDLGITKDNLNSFVFQGQAGIGVDVAFFFLETGYMYGFGDIFTDDIQSNPSQIFINLGFRF